MRTSFSKLATFLKICKVFGLSFKKNIFYWEIKICKSRHQNNAKTTHNSNGVLFTFGIEAFISMPCYDYFFYISKKFTKSERSAWLENYIFKIEKKYQIKKRILFLA